MKICTKCKKSLELSEFHKNVSKSDGLQNQCKSCKKGTDSVYYSGNKDRQKERNNLNRAKKLELLWELKRFPCSDCGKSHHPVAMDFDHISEDKEYEIANMIRDNRSWSSILNEISKCELVCAVCHRIRTFTRTGTLRL